MKRLVTTVFMILFTVASFAQIKPPQQTDTLCISSVKYNYTDIRQENWPCSVIYKSTTSFKIGEDEFLILDADKFASTITFTVTDLDNKEKYKLLYEERYSGGVSVIFSGYEFICNYPKSEVKPSFMGGDSNQFSKWVNSQLEYPKGMKRQGIQGRVTLQFTIDSDGSVVNVKVLRGVHPDLDAEAVRVVSSSPKWEPGKYRNQVVPVTMTFPVIFQLR